MPSIKGAMLRVPLESIQENIRAGVITQDAVEKCFGAEERALVADGVRDSAWYPIRFYERVCLLLKDNVGRFDANYTRKRGAESAERLLKLGVYQQAKFLRRVSDSETLEIAFQNLKLTATLWGNFFNFGTWRTGLHPQTKSFSLEVGDSKAMPSVAWDAVEGFIERLAHEVDAHRIALTRQHLSRAQVRFVFVLRS